MDSNTGTDQAARTILLCLGGIEVPNFLHKALALINPSGAVLLVLHVTDSRPFEEFGLAQHLVPGRGPRHEAAQARMQQSSQVQAEDVKAEVASFFATVPDLRYRFVSVTGRPEHEISRVARDEQVSLVVLGTGPAAPVHEGPPHALSPLARFVVDHTRCDFLLLRSAGA